MRREPYALPVGDEFLCHPEEGHRFVLREIFEEGRERNFPWRKFLELKNEKGLIERLEGYSVSRHELEWGENFKGDVVSIREDGLTIAYMTNVYSKIGERFLSSYWGFPKGIGAKAADFFNKFVEEV